MSDLNGKPIRFLYPCLDMATRRRRCAVRSALARKFVTAQDLSGNSRGDFGSATAISCTPAAALVRR